METIWRLPTVQAETGKSRTAIYEDIQCGLFSRPVKLSARAVGWPAREVQAINVARISGKTEGDIKALVVRLHDKRKGGEL